MENLVKNIKSWYHNLPEKKKYVELITALLSVPVMVTVIILNLNNLNQNKKQPTNTTSTTPIQIVITGDAQDKTKTSPTPITSPTVTPIASITPTSTPSATVTPTQCKREIGPVEILSPREGEVITKNLLDIKISTDSTYCPVAWSYQIDNGDWSDFTDKDIRVYNLTNGEKQLQIKIKSTATDEEITLKRNFTYSGNPPTPTVAPTTNP